MNTDNIAIIISIISLIGAVIGFFHNRKTFIYSIVTERAAAVKQVWNGMTKAAGLDVVTEKNWKHWSPVVSEAVSSVIIINKLAGKYKIIHWLITIKDFYIVFWEQIPTDLRTAIEKYEKQTHTTKSDDIILFRKQMETILNSYKK